MVVRLTLSNAAYSVAGMGFRARTKGVSDSRVMVGGRTYGGWLLELVGGGLCVENRLKHVFDYPQTS